MAEYSRTFGNGRPPTRTVKSRKLAVKKSEEAKEKQSRAVELRSAGASYGEIAQSLGFHDASGARKCVEAAIRKFEFEETREALKLDLARLDEWAKFCTHALRTRGDLSQIDRLMRIMDKKHYLLGVTPATLAETQPDGTHKTVGGMNVVIASTEKTFVRGMMRAVGQDPDSPEGRAYLAARGLGDELAIEAANNNANNDSSVTKPVKVRAKRLVRKSSKSGGNKSSKSSGSSGTTPRLTEVVDAEIVEESTHREVREKETARALSIKPLDEEQVEQGVKRLDERKI